MAMTSINVRVDEQDKQQFDHFCTEIGMSMSTAINLFMKAALREQKIPFELKVDPYFSGVNKQYILDAVRSYEQGEPGVNRTIEELEAMERA